MNQSSTNPLSEYPIIDPQQLEVLEDLSEPNESIVDELTRIFKSSVPGLLADLSAAVSANDRESIRRIAHRLKGSAANIGAKRMAAGCSMLELSAKNSSEPITTECFASIEEHFKASEQALVRWLEQH
ncbi:Hpt domain-containing protein [bacterium]|nr:Hpt domain-containing protein [bacterium]